MSTLLSSSQSDQTQPLLRAHDLSNFGGGFFRRLIVAATTPGHPAAYILLTLLCVFAFGIGLSTLPPTDRDESRFMQATKQMVETGDYVHIRVQDEPRRKKPIGIHWLQAAAVKIIGAPLNVPWPYRIPSALGAWAAVLMVCAIGRRLFSARAGLIAGAVMATFPLTILEAHLAKTDAALLAFTTLTMASLSWLYVVTFTEEEIFSGDLKTKPAPAVVFWLAFGAAVLVKGPVVAMIAGLTIATLCMVDRSTALIKALRPWWGFPLAMVVIAPWFVALYLGGEGSFVADAVRQDVLPKLLGGQEFHGAAPGSHAIAALATTWPWSLVIPAALIAAWPYREESAVRFCLAWLVPSWLAFEAIPTKLPNYVLPLLPALALLVGAVATQFPGVTPLLRKRGDLAWRVVWALLSVGMGAGVLVVATRYGSDGGIAAKPWALALAGTMFVAAFLSVTMIGRATMGRILSVTVALGLLFAVIAVARFAPSLDRLWVSERLADAVARHPSTQPLLLSGYHEPSAVFRLGTHIELVHPRTAAAALIAAPDRIAAVDETMYAELATPVEEAGFKVVPLETITGQNYATGKAVRLTLLTIAKP